MELLPGPTQIAAGVISYYGFGGQVTSPVAASFSDWVITRGKESGGRGFNRTNFYGDSLSADYRGAWPKKCAEILEHSYGQNVLTMNNYAVDGSTSSNMRNAVLADPQIGITDVVLFGGVNDAQNSIPVATTIDNFTAMIDYLQNPLRNINVVVVLPPDFYPKALTDNTGVVVFNEAMTPIYRQAIHRLAASKGCAVVNTAQVLKPTLAYEAKAPAAAPWFAGQYVTGRRDNIHFWITQYNAIAHAVARAIAGKRPRKRQGFELMEIPAAIFMAAVASPVAGNNAPLWQVSEDGIMSLAGRVAVTMKTDLTVIAKLPFNISPRGLRQFPIYGNNGTLGRLIIDSTDIKIAGFSAASDTQLNLDGVVFPVR
jgi:lysophospholipase L1-like esterase